MIFPLTVSNLFIAVSDEAPVFKLTFPASSKIQMSYKTANKVV